MHKTLTTIVPALLSFAIISCCDPKPRNSYPTVIDSTYSFLAVKDAFPTVNGTDSFYYPVYNIGIKNTGAEADSFKLIIDPQNGWDPLTVTQYVAPGETKILKTYGPLLSNVPDTAKVRYYGFANNDPDSLDLKILRPSVTISYGSSLDGPESCGSPAVTRQVNIDSLGKK